MSQYFPYERLKRLKIVDMLNVNSINKESPIGYTLNVDPEYPGKLHKLHNHYSLAP